MCGIFGAVSSYLIDNEINSLEKLLILNSMRGRDSAGLFDYCPGAGEMSKPLPKKEKIGPDFAYWKEAIDPLVFLGETFDAIRAHRWKKVNPKLVVGHCRSATIGLVKKENAHPFNKTPIIGVHNGTITKEFENSKKFKTDSEAIFYNIATLGLDATMEAFHKVEPHYALVWMNYRDLTLNFLRNYRRPLHYYSNVSTIFVSSEAEALAYALKPTNISSIKQFEAGVHYRVDLSKGKTSTPLEEVKKYDITKENNYTAVTYHYTHEPRPMYDAWGGANSNDWKKKETEIKYKTTDALYRQLENIYSFGSSNYSDHAENWDDESQKFYSEYQINKIKEIQDELSWREVKSTTEKKTTKGNVVPLLPKLTYDYDHFGLSVTEAKMTELLQPGCCNCASVPDAKGKEYRWIDKDNYVCGSCIKDAEADNGHYLHDFLNDKAMTRNSVG